MSALELNLRLAGGAQLLLALLHAGFGRRFDWAAELGRLSLLNRQLFRVHTFFVAFTVGLFGALSLGGARALLAGGELGRWVAGGLGLFWACRLWCQFFVYDPALWRGRRFETGVHVLFGLLWSWLTLTYGAVLGQLLGGLTVF